MSDGMDQRYQGGYTNGYDNGPRGMYHNQGGQGGRYGIGAGGRGMAPDAKMNGFHGSKHKRGDIDRECAFVLLYFNRPLYLILGFRQSFCWQSTRGLDRGNPEHVQGSARVSFLTKEARGGYPRASRYHFQRDLQSLCGPYDRYV